VRVPPELFELDVREAIMQRIRKDYEGVILDKAGFIIDVIDVQDIKEGVIIPGDGAAYYNSSFDLLTFKPELKEVIVGKIKDIADFGAFITMGPADGMIHISQTMDDFVSFAKDKVLQGRESGKTLKVNDNCRARIIAVSFKDITNPKIGLTMRQQGLGRVDWSEPEPEKKEAKKKAEPVKKRAKKK